MKKKKVACSDANDWRPVVQRYGGIAPIEVKKALLRVV